MLANQSGSVLPAAACSTSQGLGVGGGRMVPQSYHLSSSMTLPPCKMLLEAPENKLSGLGLGAGAP